MKSKFILASFVTLGLFFLTQSLMAPFVRANVQNKVPIHKSVTARFEPLKANGLNSFTFQDSQNTTAIPEEWYLDCVECPKQFLGSDHSLRLDSSNHPHIVYGGDHLYYAWYDGTNWHYETVDNAPKVGASASLVLDAADNPHISYWDRGNQNIKYAHRLNGEWQIQIVDHVFRGAGSLALDTNGRPHISYYSENEETPTTFWVKYAFWTGSSWNIQVIEQGTAISNYVIWGISLDLDSANYPHVAYAQNYLPCETCIKYARWTGDAWDIEIVEQVDVVTPTPTQLHAPKIVLDTADNPRLLYARTVRPFPGSFITDLKYAVQTSGGWDAQIIDTGSVFGGSMSLDSHDNPHISYGVFSYDQYYETIKYTYWNGNDWNSQTVDDDGSTNTSLVLKDDIPHLVYYRYLSPEVIKYAFKIDDSWTIQTIDSAGSVGGVNSLALDELGYPHISYYDLTDYILKYAHWISNTWQIESVESIGYADSLQPTSIVLDGDGYPHIGYWSVDKGVWSLKYAHWTGSSWNIQTVESSGYDTEGIALALDADGNPHIVYGPNYAYLTGSTWEIQQIPGATGGKSSMALDTAGRAHVSYSDGVGLVYAYWTGSSWAVQNVDNDGPIGESSLVLDSSGQPHISYFASSDLRYAYWNGSSWIIQTVDDDGIDGRYPSLALDGVGNAHISYIQWWDIANPFYLLKYAYQEDNTWNIQTLMNEAEANASSADLALDSGGRPHISFQDDYPNSDIKLLQLLPSLSLQNRATPEDDLQVGDALTFTLTISVSHSIVQLRNSLPENVEFIEGSLTPSTAVYISATQTIMWQGILTDTEQIISFQVRPTDTPTKASLTPAPPIVNTAYLTDVVHNRTISATAIVNGWKAYLPIIVRTP